MKTAILNYVSRFGAGVTYAELMRNIPGFAGDRLIEGGPSADDLWNIVFWSGLSQEALDAILDLLREGQVHHRAASVFAYIYDGGALALPIAKSQRRYKTPRWLPVTLNLGPDAAGAQSG